jgi:hypothetical protein
LLHALADAHTYAPNTALPLQALVASGWPEESIQPKAARTRVHTAVYTLRRMGLQGILVTREDGYLLDPELPLERRDQPPQKVT